MQGVLSCSIIDSMRSMMNSKEICLLCPSACLYFFPHSLCGLSLNIFYQKIRIQHLREAHDQVHCIFWRKQLVSLITSSLKLCFSSPSSAAISLICCHCGQFSLLGVSISSRYSAQRSSFAAGVLYPLLTD